MFEKILLKFTSVLFICIFLASVSVVSAQTKIIINAGKEIAPISKTMYGIFFEDINFGADGGLYSELIKNRSFEFPESLMGWSELKTGGSQGNLAVKNDDPFITGKTYGEPGNIHYLHIEVENSGWGYGITNEGFRGIGLHEGKKYWFSIFARSSTVNMGLKIELVDNDGQVIAEGSLDNIGKDWARHIISVTAKKTEAKAKFNLIVSRPGVLDVDMVSLFPEESAVIDASTSKPIPGLRKDIVKLLADMKPGFLRFPGGCIVEGHDLSLRYQWKNTIGEISQRKLIKNRWNTEFQHRLTEDYYQSYGLGYYEFFVLSEQIGAEPMPIQNCGMACQFNTGELVEMENMSPYVQDTLDLIEFANGSIDTKWGKARADMGHPEPFNLKMIGVGNEQWGPQYIERYKVFAEAIKAKYPEIQLVAATGSDATIFPNGAKEIEYLWSQWRQLNPEFVDEHFYRRPEWFLENTDFYDDYDRNGPEVFVGEYAAQSGGVANPDNRNNWKCALYEAAFITGLERNADLVRMTCYAPLFGHEEAWQWRPDMIWFDNLSAYGSVNYYVQKLFSLNPGTTLLSAQTSDVPNFNDKSKALTVNSTFDEEAGEVIIKVVNVSNQVIESAIEFQNVSKVGLQAKVITLSSKDLDAVDSIDEPKKISPTQSTISFDSSSISFEFSPLSFTILRIPVEK